MTFTTLLSAEDLKQHLDYPEWALVDCSFSLIDTARGGNAYERAHIPGAVYAHLDSDLSGPIVAGISGRHPLPDPGDFAETLGSWGIDASVQVVAYDDSSGNIAARLWWMVRWLGHEAVAVLDGGWRTWIKSGGRVAGGIESRNRRRFTPQPRPELIVDTSAIERIHLNKDYRIVDSRSLERFRGENEPIDPVAGRIPGAVSAPYVDNLRADGQFWARAELKSRFVRVLGGVPPERCIFYCGSGVTSAHNLLAMVHTGLGEGILYAGSWSEWIADPSRPVARGRD